MKMVCAVVQPSKLTAVREALIAVGIGGMTATQVSGIGRQKGRFEHYRGAEYQVDLLPKFKIEVAVEDSKVQDCMDTIIQIANTNKVGSGKIFLSNLEQVAQIRTGVRGMGAI